MFRAEFNIHNLVADYHYIQALKHSQQYEQNLQNWHNPNSWVRILWGSRSIHIWFTFLNFVSKSVLLVEFEAVRTAPLRCRPSIVKYPAASNMCTDTCEFWWQKTKITYDRVPPPHQISAFELHHVCTLCRSDLINYALEFWNGLGFLLPLSKDTRASIAMAG